MRIPSVRWATSFQNHHDCPPGTTDFANLVQVLQQHLLSTRGCCRGPAYWAQTTTFACMSGDGGFHTSTAMHPEKPRLLVHLRGNRVPGACLPVHIDSESHRQASAARSETPLRSGRPGIVTPLQEIAGWRPSRLLPASMHGQVPQVRA